MNIKGAIFDMDGTLLDSMHMWQTLPLCCLQSQGIEASPELREQLCGADWRKAAQTCREKYGFRMSDQEIMDMVGKRIADFYRNQVQPKAGAADFLEELRRRGVKMCVATATDQPLAEIALERCGLRDYFSAIFTVAQVGREKNDPLLFETALRHLGTAKGETYVFEDAFYAIRTAKAAGFPVFAVFDQAEKRQKELRQLADCYVSDYRQALTLLAKEKEGIE